MKEKIKVFFKGIKDSFDSIQMFKITLGVYLATFGFYFFFQAAHLVTGGVGGLSFIIATKVNDIVGKRVLNSSYIMIGLNFILLTIGRIFLGKQFFYKTFYVSLLYPFVVWMYELATDNNHNLLFNGTIFKAIEDETVKLVLSTAIGSVLTGAGLGLVFNAGATTGGTDIPQKIMNKFLKIPLSVTIYIIDGVIVLLGLIVFSIETTLFSVIAILLIGVIVDKFILTGRRGYTAFIVTREPEKLKDAIYSRLDRGFTRVNVKGGYYKDDKYMLICTVGKKEVHELRKIVNEVDTETFSFFVETTEVLGNRFERKD